jgi:hypothetical protein
LWWFVGVVVGVVVVGEAGEQGGLGGEELGSVGGVGVVAHFGQPPCPGEQISDLTHVHVLVCNGPGHGVA